MFSFIEFLKEQWIKDGDKDIYMLPTVMKAKDPRSAEVLELLSYYYDRYKTDKSAIFVAKRDGNDETLALLGATRSNIQPLIDKCLKRLKIGNFAGSEEDDKIHNQFVFIFIKENFFRELVSVKISDNHYAKGRHLYIKFQFIYKDDSFKPLSLGKKQRARIDPSEIILKDISVHPTDKLTI